MRSSLPAPGDSECGLFFHILKKEIPYSSNQTERDEQRERNQTLFTNFTFKKSFCLYNNVQVLILLYCTLKMVDFMLCVFYHNLKNPFHA